MKGSLFLLEADPPTPLDPCPEGCTCLKCRIHREHFERIYNECANLRRGAEKERKRVHSGTRYPKD